MSVLTDPALLLDTHILAWWLGAPERLHPGTIDAISTRGRRVLVSAASVYEMALKHRRGHWPEVATIVGDPIRQLAMEGMHPLAIDLGHANRAGLLVWDHRDPFDRLLAAQAIAEGARLVTSDKVFMSLPGLDVLWN